jgi:hypothetical protein
MKSWQVQELLYALIEVVLFFGITSLLFEGAILVISNILNILIVIWKIIESWC